MGTVEKLLHAVFVVISGVLVSYALSNVMCTYHLYTLSDEKEKRNVKRTLFVNIVFAVLTAIMLIKDFVPMLIK